MRNCLNGFVIFLMLLASACTEGAREPVIEYVETVPHVPKDLRTPVEVEPRKVEGLQSVGLILADHVEGLEVANGKILATDCILTAAEEGRDVAPAECAPTPKHPPF